MDLNTDNAAFDPPAANALELTAPANTPAHLSTHDAVAVLRKLRQPKNDDTNATGSERAASAAPAETTDSSADSTDDAAPATQDPGEKTENADPAHSRESGEAPPSLPIHHAGGTYPPKPLIPILGGLLTFESEWNPPLGQALEDALKDGNAEDRLELGCIAAHGHFSYDGATKRYAFTWEGRPATAFLFNLISQLQYSGTVPMIDVQAYARWLAQ